MKAIRFSNFLTAVLLVLIAHGKAQELPSKNMPVAPDQLGTIRDALIACPSIGLKATACYALEIACPKMPDYTAYAKIVAPPDPWAP